MSESEMKPLSGIRVLSMEQAAALPFATRHLADLGAEVIRVQSHKRPVGVLQEVHYYRNKKIVGLDLAHPDGPETFRSIAANVDVVAHNFTPRVMRKYQIDFANLAKINPNIIYCSVTGFGTTGPWADRPLFGPGAEAMSGQNAMMGEPDALTPGRPGTITYADNVCGLYLLFAVLGALEQRARIPGPRHVEVSLYETGVAHIGTVIAERSAGAAAPEAVGTPALDVADAARVVADPDRWRRGCFAVSGADLTTAPVWGGGADEVWTAGSVGEHNGYVLSDVAQLAPERVQAAAEQDVVGEVPVTFQVAEDPQIAVAIDRGLVDRIEPDFATWRSLIDLPRSKPWRLNGSATVSANRRVVEVAGSVAVAYAAKQFADLGWDVVRVGSREDVVYRWGESTGAAGSYLDLGKRTSAAPLHTLLSDVDVLIGDESVADIQGPRVVTAVTGYGLDNPRQWTDLQLQADSGFMSVTGEFDERPQQLPPYAAEMTGGLAAASVTLAAYLTSLEDDECRTIDFTLVDVLTGFIQSQTGRYATTGEVARREGRVKHALRMVPTAEGYLYCAPGAVMNVAMDGVAELTGEHRLAEPRFATAEGRMAHWEEYVDLMVGAFATKTAREWFVEAQNHHLTFALVQSVDDILACEQLAARDAFIEAGGAQVPRSGFRIEAAIPDPHTQAL